MEQIEDPDMSTHNSNHLIIDKITKHKLENR